MHDQNSLADQDATLKSPQFLPVQFYLFTKDPAWGAGALEQWTQVPGGIGNLAHLSFTVTSGLMEYQAKGMVDLTGVKTVLEVNVAALADTSTKIPAFTIIQVEGETPPFSVINTAIISKLIVDAFDQQKSLFAAAFGVSPSKAEDDQ